MHGDLWPVANIDRIPNTPCLIQACQSPSRDNASCVRIGGHLLVHQANLDIEVLPSSRLTPSVARTTTQHHAREYKYISSPGYMHLLIGVIKEHPHASLLHRKEALSLPASFSFDRRQT